MVEELTYKCCFPTQISKDVVMQLRPEILEIIRSGTVYGMDVVQRTQKSLTDTQTQKHI